MMENVPVPEVVHKYVVAFVAVEFDNVTGVVEQVVRSMPASTVTAGKNDTPRLRVLVHPAVEVAVAVITTETPAISAWLGV